MRGKRTFCREGVRVPGNVLCGSGLAMAMGLALLGWPCRVQAEADERDCGCGEPDPKVEVVCEGPGTVPILKLKAGGIVSELSPGDERLARLALEVWDGKRYQEMRCDAKGDPVAVATGVPSPGVRGAVYPLFRAFTGRETWFRLAGRGAVVRREREDGTQVEKPFEVLGAVSCSGPRPTVMVSLDTVEKALEAGGVDLLAFILGHELGHRATAMTESGDRCLGGRELQRAARALASREPDIEGWADARGAFYAGMAGYRMGSLKARGVVDAYLARHHGKQVDDHQRRRRAEALSKAFEEFDTYVGIYRTALVLLFFGGVGSGVSLLNWVTEVMEDRRVSVPEVRYARALGLMMRSGAQGPWSESVPEEVSSLACVPVHPEWPAMSDAMGWVGWRGRLRGTGGWTREDARMDLDEAVKMLEEAKVLGMSPLSVWSALACARLYLGEFKAALEAQKAAEGFLKRDAAEVLWKTLGANRALMEFGAWLERAGSRRSRREWSKAAGRYEANPALMEVLRGLGGGGRGGSGPEPACKEGGNTGALGGFSMPEAPRFPGRVGRCPQGWSHMYSLPAASEAGDVASQGVTACERARSGPGWEVAVHVRMMGATSPPAAGVDLVVLLTGGFPEGARTRQDWEGGCERLCRRGVSDVGEEAFEAYCPKAGLESGLIFVGKGGLVERVAVVR